MQKGPSEIDVVQISRTESINVISRNVIATWLIRFHRNAFYAPEINGNTIVYISDLTFEIRARAVRHVTMEHTRELPLEQKLNLHQVGIPLKDIPTCSSMDIYHMCRTRHFRGKGQCATEIQLLNTPHDRRCCHGDQAMTPPWCSSISTLCFPQKTGAWTFATGGGGDNDTCHQDYMVTWQRRRRLLSIQALICFW